MKKIIVAGIGTDVGKTIVSAILVKMLKADYWKPIQCGNLSQCDTSTIKQLVHTSGKTFHQEAYRLTHACSPHQAANLEGLVINPDDIKLPKTSNNLVIECAGGVLVPFNNNYLQLDLLCQWDCNWVVTTKNYLGSINHTLLTLEALKQRKQNIIGLIFNGKEEPYSEKVIKNYAKTRFNAHLKQEKIITSQTINLYEEVWKEHIPHLIS